MNKDFVAGLIVGEGCFYLGVQRIKERKGSLRITPGFRLFMNDHETIDLVVEWLKEQGLPVYVQERKDGGKGIHAAGLLRASRYCAAFADSLTGTKREACLLVHYFIVSRLRKPKGAPYDSVEIEYVRQLREVNGNRKGRKTPL